MTAENKVRLGNRYASGATSPTGADPRLPARDAGAQHNVIGVTVKRECNNTQQMSGCCKHLHHQGVPLEAPGRQRIQDVQNETARIRGPFQAAFNSDQLQLGNLNEPMRVLQLNAPFAVRYSVVNQNVQSSTGSSVMAL